MEKAIVKRVIGPVVDVHFPSGQLPELYHAVEVPLEGRKVVMEVVQQIGGGDVRAALGVLENVYSIAKDKITLAAVRDFTPAFTGNFDRSGDVHYDLLSCLQKSVRGFDAVVVR